MAYQYISINLPDQCKHSSAAILIVQVDRQVPGFGSYHSKWNISLRPRRSRLTCLYGEGYHTAANITNVKTKISIFVPLIRSVYL